ncbi:unnamed protein product [Acanthoscelides obtectus]
MASLY